MAADGCFTSLRVAGREFLKTGVGISRSAYFDDGGVLKLRVFVDRSVLEVFANGRQAVVRRIYPARGDSTGVAVFAEGGGRAAPSLHGLENGAQQSLLTGRRRPTWHCHRGAQWRDWMRP